MVTDAEVQNGQAQGDGAQERRAHASLRRRAREQAGISRIDVAARTRFALNTIDRYELDPCSVREQKRIVLDDIYAPWLTGCGQSR
jgi:ribosome-binding protein aMBF1 (putative translation factor)